jgi:hypothetical protein
MTLDHTVTTMTLDHTVATMTMDTTTAFVIPLVALLTSSPVMRRKEHHWNASVLQRVHIPSLVIFCSPNKKWVIFIKIILSTKFL